eukprot:Nk52_evm13s277 gene=Nk52_evmTU13s277
MVFNPRVFLPPPPPPPPVKDTPLWDPQLPAGGDITYGYPAQTDTTTQRGHEELPSSLPSMTEPLANCPPLRAFAREVLAHPILNEAKQDPIVRELVAALTNGMVSAVNEFLHGPTTPSSLSSVQKAPLSLPCPPPLPSNSPRKGPPLLGGYSTGSALSQESTQAGLKALNTALSFPGTNNKKGGDPEGSLEGVVDTQNGLNACKMLRTWLRESRAHFGVTQTDLLSLQQQVVAGMNYKGVLAFPAYELHFVVYQPLGDALPRFTYAALYLSRSNQACDPFSKTPSSNIQQRHPHTRRGLSIFSTGRTKQSGFRCDQGEPDAGEIPGGFSSADDDVKLSFLPILTSVLKANRPILFASDGPFDKWFETVPELGQSHLAWLQVQVVAGTNYRGAIQFTDQAGQTMFQHFTVFVPLPHADQDPELLNTKLFKEC